jgi:hypothetical protein
MDAIRRLVLALALSAEWASCSGDQPKPAPRVAEASAVPAPAKLEDTAANEARKPAHERSLSRLELQQLLDTWLEAQNEGDFATYQSLYTPHMRGVKRVGEREYRMDHAQWMRDRERMFKKKMEVEAHTVRFHGGMATAVLEFVQVFHSGKFMDSGTKRLVIIMHDGEPRIMSEEMLSSDVLITKAAFEDRVYLTFPVGDATYVAIQERADPSWGSGKFTIEGTESPEPYVQSVDAARAQSEEQWLNTSVRVYDENGAACDATVTELKLMLLVDTYEIHDEAEAARIDALGKGDKVQAIAQLIIRDEPPMLVGRLSTCRGVLATRPDEPAPTFFLRQDLEPAITRAVITATKAHARYQALQKAWEVIWRAEGENGQPPEEPAGEWATEGEVILFGASPGPRFATFRCGNQGGEALMQDVLFALYRVESDGALTLLRMSSQTTAPERLVDVNVDGVPEIIGSEGVRSLYDVSSYGLSLIKLVPYIYNGCTC